MYICLAFERSGPYLKKIVRAATQRCQAISKSRDQGLDMSHDFQITPLPTLKAMIIVLHTTLCEEMLCQKFKSYIGFRKGNL